MNEPTHFKKGKTICLDFDGVIHMYDTPWTATEDINDEPVPGVFGFIEDAIDEGWHIAIHSCRSELASGREAMRVWTHQRMRNIFDSGKTGRLMSNISFPEWKPHADMYIDDRGYQFDGNWPDLEYIKGFKPWNKVP